MENKITVLRMVNTQVVVGKQVTCDVCGKLIKRENEKDLTYCIGKYWRLTTGHNDWGNDSCESMKTEDICSAECLRERLDDYVKRDGTSYFEVECEDYS